MNKEKSIITILSISLIALLFLGARTYYPQGAHMMGGMHGQPYIERKGNYETYGHGMMGLAMMNYGYGMMGRGTGGCYMMGGDGVTDYYLYNKETLNLSENQVETLKSLRSKYYEENLILREELYEKNFELQKLLYEKKVDFSEIKSLTNEIGRIEAKLRYNGIESFAKARNVLTEEQTSKLGSELFRSHMH